MPDFMHILAVEPKPPIEEPPYEGADDLVWEDIEEIVRDVMAAAPGFDFTLLYSGTRDWVDVHAWVVRDGHADSEALQLSRRRDVCDGSHAKPAPEVTLALDTDADVLLDALEWASREGDEVELEGREVQLPFHFSGGDRLLDAAALVAKHLASDPEVVLVDVDDRWYELRLTPRVGAELVPLWPWMSDPAARALAQRALGEPGSPTERGCPSSDAPRGRSLRARMGVLEETTSFEELARAWTAPENRGERTDALRQLLVDRLVVVDPERAIAVITTSLANERTAVRETIYETLSKTNRSDARSAVVAGYRAEEPSVRAFIGTIVWRNEKMIETLVREGLFPAWTQDPTHAKRILKLIDEECLRVHRTWLVDAPAGLIRALEGKIVY